MKNYRKIVIAAMVVLMLNIAMVAVFLIQDSKPQSGDVTEELSVQEVTVIEPVDVTGTDVPDVVTETDVVTVTDVEEEPEPEMPKVVMTSLEGTELATRIDEIAGPNKNNCCGLSVAVIKDGAVAYNYEYGYANRSQTREVDSGTKFRIASLTKVFTSMLAMKLSEEGKLDLDADISNYLDYQVRNPHHRDVPITFRMLLTHTSSYMDGEPIFTYSLKTDILNNNSYNYSTPGTAHQYSNLGMGIAGALVERVSGKVLTEFAREAFFDGMGIDAAFNGALLADTNVAECLSGREVKRSEAEMVSPHGNNEPGENNTVGAGGLIISAVDYAKLMTLMINDGMYENVRYFQSDTVEDIHEVQFEYYKYDQCIGIRKSSDILDGRTVYYHTGAAYGIFSLAIYDTSDNSGVVVFTTGSYDRVDENGVRRSCIDTAIAVYEELIGDPAAVSDTSVN